MKPPIFTAKIELFERDEKSVGGPGVCMSCGGDFDALVCIAICTAARWPLAAHNAHVFLCVNCADLALCVLAGEGPE